MMTEDKRAGSEDDLTFEQALHELESIVARLEDGELSLEASLQLFERGQNLARRCNEQLEVAALKVEQLTEHGEIKEISEVDVV